MADVSESVIQTNELFVRVMDLESVLYEGSVRSISAVNDKGPFDVLPMHSNFITLIKKTISIEENSGKKRTFDISTGVLICKQNQVRIYLGL